MAVTENLAVRCPRCESTNTKFCYYNNYSLSQPRYFCKACRRYWTQGGTLRESTSSSSSSSSLSVRASTSADSVVTLLDYGAGNVRSVRNAIRPLSFDVKDSFYGLPEFGRARDGTLPDYSARNVPSVSWLRSLNIEDACRGVGAFARAVGAINVRNAFRSLGLDIEDVQTREDILNADRLIFPDVGGAFASAMDVLNQTGKKAMDTSRNGDMVKVVIQDPSGCMQPQEIVSSRIDEDLRKRVLKLEEQMLQKLAGDLRNSVHDSSSQIVKRKDALMMTISKQEARLLGLATMFVGVLGLLMGGVLQQSNLKCKTCYIPMSATFFSSVGFLIGMWHSAKKYMTSLKTMQRIQSQLELELGNRGEGIPPPEGSPTNYWSKEEEEFGQVAHRQRVIQIKIAGFVMVACTTIVVLTCPLIYCTE